MALPKLGEKKKLQPNCGNAIAEIGRKKKICGNGIAEIGRKKKICENLIVAMPLPKSGNKKKN